MTIADYLALTGLFLVALTLTANAIQTRHVAKQSAVLAKAEIASLRYNLNDHLQQVTHVFVDEPHLRKYFFDGAPIDPGSEDVDAALAVAELYFDAMYFTLESGLPFDQENSTSWMNFYRLLVVNSPAMQLFWHRHSRLYGARVRKPVDDWLRTAAG